MTEDEITIQEYLDTLTPRLSDELYLFRLTGEKGNVPIIKRETERLLTAILRLKRPGNILEIGTAIGYSAAFFASLLPEARVTTIEKDEGMYKAALRNIETIGLTSRVRVILGDGQEQTEKLKEAGEGPFDMIFLDAAKSHYNRFLESALDVAADGALIISDNIMQHGMTASEPELPARKHRTNVLKMREYLAFITEDPRFTTSLLGSGDGLAITIYNKE